VAELRERARLDPVVAVVLERLHLLEDVHEVVLVVLAARKVEHHGRELREIRRGGGRVNKNAEQNDASRSAAGEPHGGIQMQFSDSSGGGVETSFAIDSVEKRSPVSLNSWSWKRVRD
jgi:hypothetical protein